MNKITKLKNLSHLVELEDLWVCQQVASIQYTDRMCMIESIRLHAQFTGQIETWQLIVHLHAYTLSSINVMHLLIFCMA